MLWPGRSKPHSTALERAAGDGQPLCMDVPEAEPGNMWLCLRRGDLRPGLPSMVMHGWAPGATSWLLLGSVSVASGHLCCQPVLALHPRVGAERCGALQAVGDGVGGFGGPTMCCPSTACSKCGTGTLQAAISPPQLVPLAPVRGKGVLSLLSPRGGTHTPGGQSRSARLCRLWACSESPAALLFPGLQAPRSHPQASWALLPGLIRHWQRVGGAQSITQTGESLLRLPTVQQHGQCGCACPGHSSALQEGVTSPTACLPSPLCKTGRAPRFESAGQEAGSSTGRTPHGND